MTVLITSWITAVARARQRLLLAMPRTVDDGSGQCKAGFTDDDLPRAPNGSGQCKAGFIGDDHPLAAHGSGQCKAGLGGDVSLHGVFVQWPVRRCWSSQA